jgi:hypothetical protein
LVVPPVGDPSAHEGKKSRKAGKDPVNLAGFIVRDLVLFDEEKDEQIADSPKGEPFAQFGES